MWMNGLLTAAMNISLSLAFHLCAKHRRPSHPSAAISPIADTVARAHNGQCINDARETNTHPLECQFFNVYWWHTHTRTQFQLIRLNSLQNLSVFKAYSFVSIKWIQSPSFDHKYDEPCAWNEHNGSASEATIGSFYRIIIGCLQQQQINKLTMPI